MESNLGTRSSNQLIYSRGSFSLSLDKLLFISNKNSFELPARDISMIQLAVTSLQKNIVILLYTGNQMKYKKNNKIVQHFIF